MQPRFIEKEAKMTKRIVLIIGALLLAVLPSQAQDDPENLIEYGDVLRAEIAADGGINVWEFEAQAGDVVLIDVQSDDFDPVVELFQDGELLAEDDDSGYMSDARLEGDPLPADGRYQVFVKSAFASDGGEYLLQLSGGQAVDERDTLPLNESIVATIPDGGVDEWPLMVEADSIFYLAVRSNRQDLLLTINDADGEVAQDDDSGGDLNPLLRDVNLAAGEYTVVVESAVNVDVSGSAYVIEAFTTAVDAPIVGSGLYRGVAVSDDAMPTWVISAGSGDTVQVVLRSEFFDPVLTVIAPDGSEFATDDDSAAAFQGALLDLTFDTAGDYQLRIERFGEGSGPYELIVIDGE